MSDGAARIFKIGVTLCALSWATLGALEAWRGAPLPGLHAFPEAAPDILVRIGGALLVASSLAMIGGAFVRWAAWFGAVLWLLWCGLALIAASATPYNGTAWVPVLETAAFAAIAWALTGGGHTATAARIVFGLMLIGFGAVHLTNRELITSLIPGWIPFGAHWPWFTGAVNLAAGFACVAGRGVKWSGFAIAAMFGAWLPLVHAPRLMASVESLFEWTFALTALALSGAALQVASGFAGTPARR